MNFIHHLFFEVHPAIIHFMIVGFIVAAVSSLIRLGLIIKSRDFVNTRQNSFMRQFTKVNYYMAIFAFPVIAATGLLDAGGFKYAVKMDLLAFKMFLASILVILILFREIYVYIYKTEYSNNSLIITAIHTFLMVLLASITVIIAGAGGMYVFGHTILENVGLGWLIDTNFTQSMFYSHTYVIVAGSIIITELAILLLIRIPYDLVKKDIQKFFPFTKQMHNYN